MIIKKKQIIYRQIDQDVCQRAKLMAVSMGSAHQFHHVSVFSV